MPAASVTSVSVAALPGFADHPVGLPLYQAGQLLLALVVA